jgi:uncharacterized protein YwgA
MNRRQIALKLVLDGLGMAPTMDSFDQRLTLQKTIYLIQQLGVPLGYHFSWYLRGPYSSELTSDAYANLDSEVPEGWTLGKSLDAKLSKAKPFIDRIRKKRDSVQELEKLASVLFVIKTGQASVKDTGKITARMQAAGKGFTQEEVDDAVQTLHQNGFLPETEDSGR